MQLSDLIGAVGSISKKICYILAVLLFVCAQKYLCKCNICIIARCEELLVSLFQSFSVLCYIVQHTCVINKLVSHS